MDRRRSRITGSLTAPDAAGISVPDEISPDPSEAAALSRMGPGHNGSEGA